MKKQLDARRKDRGNMKHIASVSGGKIVTGCQQHKDEKHQQIAVNLGYCEDFHCENAEDGEDV